MLVGVVTVLTAVILAVLEGTGIDSRLGLAISLLLITPVPYVLFKRWTFRLR
jgi:putative flippase GtrA